MQIDIEKERATYAAWVYSFQERRSITTWDAWLAAKRHATQAEPSGASVDNDLYAAVAKLIKAKGRFHTEQNYAALVAAFDRVSPALSVDSVARDAARWRAFRARDEFDDLSFEDFQDQFREDADAVVDAAMSQNKENT